MASMDESQTADALKALRSRDPDLADRVRGNDQQLNELYRQHREQCFSVIATQQPVARDLRLLMGIVYISAELERMGDYAVRIARMTSTLCGLPAIPLRAEFGLMGDLAARQVHDILDSLIELDSKQATEVAAKYHEL